MTSHRLVTSVRMVLTLFPSRAVQAGDADTIHPGIPYFIAPLGWDAGNVYADHDQGRAGTAMHKATPLILDF